VNKVIAFAAGGERRKANWNKIRREIWLMDG